MGVIFLPLTASLIFDFESWPLTSAPMFAHYVSEETPLYRFRFVGLYKEQSVLTFSKEIFPPHIVGNFWFDFYFFGKVYGSFDQASPFGKHFGENKAAFESRLTRIFNLFIKYPDFFHVRDIAALQGIRLDVVQITHKREDREAHTVGHFDKASGIFIHQWKSDVKEYY